MGVNQPNTGDIQPIGNPIKIIPCQGVSNSVNLHWLFYMADAGQKIKRGVD